jgi:hypothetical protein
MQSAIFPLLKRLNAFFRIVIRGFLRNTPLLLRGSRHEGVDHDGLASAVWGVRQTD